MLNGNKNTPKIRRFSQINENSVTPFFSKITPKLPFLAEEAQINFLIFFLHFQL
jgi:hypothetical protein